MLADDDLIMTSGIIEQAGHGRRQGCCCGAGGSPRSRGAVLCQCSQVLPLIPEATKAACSLCAPCRHLPPSCTSTCSWHSPPSAGRQSRSRHACGRPAPPAAAFVPGVPRPAALRCATGHRCPRNPRSVSKVLQGSIPTVHAANNVCCCAGARAHTPIGTLCTSVGAPSCGTHVRPAAPAAAAA